MDFSDHSKRLLEDTTRVFEGADGQEFHFVYVWHAPAFGYEDGVIAGLEDKLEDFIKDFAPSGDYQVKTTLLSGHPSTEICRYAKEADCDLIALATHGHTGVKHLVIGSTAENVVRYAPCHVLTVRIAG